MDAPPIQYARTEDGVSIAYWTLGKGPPFVLVNGPRGSHIQLEWEGPAAAAFYQRLAESHTLIRFDPRGSGISDHSPGR